MNLRHYVEQKKPETVEYIIYDSTYMVFKNKQNYGDRGQKSEWLPLWGRAKDTDWEGSFLGRRD